MATHSHQDLTLGLLVAALEANKVDREGGLRYGSGRKPGIAGKLHVNT
jgi:hypothetical protein